jgi:hypothetical protein
LMLAHVIALGPSIQVPGQAAQCGTQASIRREREAKFNQLVTEY